MTNEGLLFRNRFRIYSSDLTTLKSVSMLVGPHMGLYYMAMAQRSAELHFRPLHLQIVVQHYYSSALCPTTVRMMRLFLDGLQLALLSSCFLLHCLSLNLGVCHYLEVSQLTSTAMGRRSRSVCHWSGFQVE
jgi:hypothetical protein